MQRRRWIRNGLLAVAGLACALSQAAAAPPEILVLSNRADVVSGGDALVEIKWPAGTNLSALRVALNGTIVTSQFAMRPNGRYMGLLTGLKNGSNVLLARHSAGAAQMTIKNHPSGGPVFAGAQLQPWICATMVAKTVTVTVAGTGSANATTKVSGLASDPVDDQCNAASRYTYYYQPKAREGTACTFSNTGASRCFEPFPTIEDPASRPADDLIANFTNDRGVSAKSIVRVERGAVNRGIYELVTFYDPAVASAPWSPQPGWNGKLLWKFGASSSYSRFQQPPGTSVWDNDALSRGFMVASGSLTDHGTNANDSLGAEAMMMAKERIVEKYGLIRYTIGNGCSGGSIFQYQLAASYPGLLDGIQPTCTFPDTFSNGIEVTDCGLLQGNYFSTATGSALSTAKKAAILGHNNTGFCAQWISSFLPNYNPSNPGCGSGFPASLIYHPTLRPNGVRCTSADHAAGIMGSFVDFDGNTKAPSPIDNEGVQYGLKALQAGTINVEEFVSLNEGAGSYTTDRIWIPPARKAALSSALHTVYTSGLVSDAKQLARTPIIDLRGNQAAGGCIHANWRAWEARARMDQANGHHGNHVIWGYTGGGSASPGAALALKSLLTMDQWLAGIEADPTPLSLEQKVLNNKPGTAVDFCMNATGATDAQLAAAGPFGVPPCPITFQASPRQAAGGPQTENVFKCQRKAIDFASADYNGATFTPDQQARMNAVFQTGVCDWTLPGVEQVPAYGWASFAAGPGAAGVPLGPPPVSVPLP